MICSQFPLQRGQGCSSSGSLPKHNDSWLEAALAMTISGFLEDKSWCRLVQPGLLWEQAEEMLFKGGQQNRAVLLLPAFCEALVAAGAGGLAWGC